MYIHSFLFLPFLTSWFFYAFDPVEGKHDYTMVDIQVRFGGVNGTTAESQ